MAKDRVVCPHCGALQGESDDVCELCGSPLDENADSAGLSGDGVETLRDEGPQAKAKRSRKGAAGGAPAPSKGTRRRGTKAVPVTPATGGFCTACGTPYPEGARFCGSCGEKIVRPTTPAPIPVEETPVEYGSTTEPAQSTDRELGRQILIVVGAGVLLVVGLFFITIASKQEGAPDPAVESTVIEVTPDPLPPDVAGTEAALLKEIALLTGAERQAKQSELMDFYLTQSRMDLAGAVQDSIARETGAEVDWIRAGNLYYDWMEGVEGVARAAYAKKAIAAYQQALAINPNNNDVRTDMAIAYMYDPDNGMQAILQTNQVLAEDPDHVQANFNKGIMLLRINRFDEAAAQFERVKSIIGDSTNEVYRRAQDALQAVQQLQRPG